MKFIQKCAFFVGLSLLFSNPLRAMETDNDNNRNNTVRILKAGLHNFNKDEKREWISYTTSAWHPLEFKNFYGDVRFKGNNLKHLKIPEDGIYSLAAHYYLLGESTTKTCCYSAISINNEFSCNTTQDEFSELVTRIGSKRHYFVVNGQIESGDISRTTHLKKNDEVSFVLYGGPAISYHNQEFRLEIEKLY